MLSNKPISGCYYQCLLIGTHTKFFSDIEHVESHSGFSHAQLVGNFCYLYTLSSECQYLHFPRCQPKVFWRWLFAILLVCIKYLWRKYDTAIIRRADIACQFVYQRALVHIAAYFFSPAWLGCSHDLRGSTEPII